MLVALRIEKLLFVAALFVLLLVGGVGLVSAETMNQTDGTASDCVIPPSGPWPPCATGGQTASAPNTSSDCVIPSSGPWPPCATQGNNAAPAPANNDSDCVIPPSGPWPPCASGGQAPPPASSSANGSCEVPPSGPWPACATGGAGSSATNNTASQPAPAPQPTEAPSQTQTTEFAITNAEIFTKSSHEMTGRLYYVNMPADYRPQFLIFDPDNCFGPCENANILGGYHIDGRTGTRDRGTPANGSFDFVVDIDNLICPHNPVTNRLIFAVTSYDNIESRGDVIYTVMGQLEVHHEWCK